MRWMRPRTPAAGSCIPSTDISSCEGAGARPAPFLKSAGLKSAGKHVVLALHEFLGGLHGHGRVAAVGVGADGLAEFLVQRRAADEDDVIVAKTLFLHRVDDDLHV